MLLASCPTVAVTMPGPDETMVWFTGSHGSVIIPESAKGSLGRRSSSALCKALENPASGVDGRELILFLCCRAGPLTFAGDKEC